MKTQHLSWIGTDSSKVGTAVAEVEEAVPRKLRRGKRIPYSSPSTFIVDKNGGIVAKAILCRQTLRVEEWGG